MSEEQLDPAEAFARVVTAAANRYSIEYDVPLEAASLMSQLSASLADPCIRAGIRALTGRVGGSYMEYTLGMYVRLWRTIAPHYNSTPERFTRCASDIFEAVFNHVEEIYATSYAAAKLKKQGPARKV